VTILALWAGRLHAPRHADESQHPFGVALVVIASLTARTFEIVKPSPDWAVRVMAFGQAIDDCAESILTFVRMTHLVYNPARRVRIVLVAA
jgi:hypothetical protein